MSKHKSKEYSDYYDDYELHIIKVILNGDDYCRLSCVLDNIQHKTL